MNAEATLFIAAMFLWLGAPVLPALRQYKKAALAPLYVPAGNKLDASAGLSGAIAAISRGDFSTPVDGVSVSRSRRFDDTCPLRGKVACESDTSVSGTQNAFEVAWAPRFKLEADAVVHGALTASQRISVAPGARFRVLQAPKIFFEGPVGDLSARRPEDVATPGSPEGAVFLKAQGWWHATGDVLVREDLRVEGDIVASGSVFIRRGACVHGSIKARRTILVSEAASVHGSVTANRIELSQDVEISGCVLAEDAVVLGRGCRIGLAGAPTTISAERVQAHPGVEVRGGICAHAHGEALHV